MYYTKLFLLPILTGDFSHLHSSNRLNSLQDVGRGSGSKSRWMSILTHQPLLVREWVMCLIFVYSRSFLNKHPKNNHEKTNQQP